MISGYFPVKHHIYIYLLFQLPGKQPCGSSTLGAFFFNQGWSCTDVSSWKSEVWMVSMSSLRPDRHLNERHAEMGHASAKTWCTCQRRSEEGREGRIRDVPFQLSFGRLGEEVSVYGVRQGKRSHWLPWGWLAWESHLGQFICITVSVYLLAQIWITVPAMNPKSPSPPVPEQDRARMREHRAKLQKLEAEMEDKAWRLGGSTAILLPGVMIRRLEFCKWWLE